MAEEQKPAAPAPRKIQKPLNPLAMKPGQKYDSVKYAEEKAYQDILKDKK